MKTNFITFWCLALLLITFGCQQRANNSDLPKTSIDSTAIRGEKLLQDLKSKPKLFLDYWSGMTYEEFSAVSRLLEKEGIVKVRGSVYYNLGSSELEVNRYFSDQDFIGCNGYSNKENTKIGYGINLWGFEESEYKIFQEKYSLPDFIEKNRSTVIMEDNPLAANENAHEHAIGQNRIEMTIDDIFRFIGGENNQFKYRPEFFINRTRITVPKNIKIEKEDVVILFEDVEDICSSDSKLVYLYLENNKQSAKRLVLTLDYSNMRVSYLPKSYYEKLKSEENNRDRKYDIEKLQEQQNKENRILKSKDEI